MTNSLSKSVDLLRNYSYRSYPYHLLPYYDPRYAHQFPFFGFGTIDMMLRDSRVRYGLNLIKGPIFTYTKFFSTEESKNPAVNQAIVEREYHFSYKVEAADTSTEEFILQLLNRFWTDGLYKALRAIEWGYAPNQILYERLPSGQIQYKGMISYHPRTCRPVTKSNEVVGIYISERNKKICFPKAFIHVHQRENDPWCGLSRLFGAHIPWHETWSMGGARDVRKLWYFKNSYDSGTLYYPPGSVKDEGTGMEKDNLELALEIMDSQQTGSYRVFPKANAERNQLDWQYEEPRSRTTPDGLREYITDLRNEILEGMGIPSEIVESSSNNGMGSSTGRKIPMLAFISSLTPCVSELLIDIKSQLIDTMLRVNGMPLEYNIEPITPMMPVEIPNQNLRDNNADLSE